MSEKSLITTYNFYWKISEILFDRSIITYTTLNSNRIDKASMTIFYLYDKNTDEIIGEEARDFFSIKSLNSSAIEYGNITNILNIFDKLIILGYSYGAIYDYENKKLILSENTIFTKDFLGNPVEIKKLPDDPLKPDNVYYSIAVFEK